MRATWHPLVPWEMHPRIHTVTWSLKNCSRRSPRKSTFPCTMVQISQKSRRKYWATHLSICALARYAHSFACLHCSRRLPQLSTLLCTMVQISKKSRCKYWATHLSVRSLICWLLTACFAHTLHCAHSFACSLTLLTPSLEGQ